MEYKIIKIGQLKNSRVKSLYTLKKNLNGYSFCYTYRDIKDLLDAILEDNFKESFDLKIKLALDEIFEGNEYERVDEFYEGRNFPIDWIPPIG